jgi:phosphate transport system protein
VRDSYREELDDINAALVAMANAVGSAMSTATTALLDADVALADLVIAGDKDIDETRESIEQRCFTLLARQQPVAGDLRTITTAMRIVSDLERMGDLAEHIAKLARMRFPDHAVPQEVRPAFLEAGHVAEMLVAKTGQVIAKRDVEAARELETVGCSASCSPTTGPTASRRRSTSPCSAATTSGSPTTPSASPAGWSTW